MCLRFTFLKVFVFHLMPIQIAASSGPFVRAEGNMAVSSEFLFARRIVM